MDPNYKTEIESLFRSKADEQALAREKLRKEAEELANERAQFVKEANEIFLPAMSEFVALLSGTPMSAAFSLLNGSVPLQRDPSVVFVLKHNVSSMGKLTLEFNANAHAIFLQAIVFATPTQPSPSRFKLGSLSAGTVQEAAMELVRNAAKRL